MELLIQETTSVLDSRLVEVYTTNFLRDNISEQLTSVEQVLVFKFELVV